MALPDASPKDGSIKKAADGQQDGQDKDFDPSAEALIHEIDDERTLEEEEALNTNNEKAVQEELDDLKKESEMPIEELLAYYERMRNDAAGEANEDEEEEEEEDEEDEEDEEEDEEYDDGDEDENEKRDRREPPPKRRRDAREGSTNAQPDSASGSSSTAKPPTSQQQDNNKSQKNSDQQQNSDTTLATSQLTNSHGDTASSSHNQLNQPLTTNLNTQIGAQQTQCKFTSASLVDSQQSTISSQECHVGSTPTDTANNNEQAKPETLNTSQNSPHQNQSKQTRQSLTNYFIEADEGSSIFDSLFANLDDSDSVDEDYSYTDDENDDRDFRREIHVGPDYQAIIPDSLMDYHDFPPYENEDKLVWKCCAEISQEKLLDYLKTGSSLSKKNDFSISPGNVPKFSHESMRLYNERLHDTPANLAPQSEIQNNNGPSTILLIPDVYMSRSRKRARIDYELEQENAIDGMEQNIENRNVPMREDNSDSTSQETKPELSTEDYFYDEEQLLFLLLQCNHKIEEALRRRKIDPFKFYLHEPMTIWSQEECLGFEDGLRLYGKNFRSIRDMKVPTRTYAEVVGFYYLWKKSERHDVYTNRYKLDRKKCLSHPGTTDYMDKFIEDNESNINATSSTPTLTDSTAGPISNVNVSGDINLTVPHSLESRPAIHFISLSPDTIGQNHHIQLHQSQKAETCVEDK